MLASMSSRSLSEWMAFAQLEPFGDEWRQTGLITSLIAETHRDPDQRSESFTPEDFMPKYESTVEQMDWQAQLMLVEMMNAAFGGKDLRNK